MRLGIKELSPAVGGMVAGGPDVSGEDDFGVPHVSRLHVGLRLTGAGRDFR